jgi:hypothetical protein
MTEIPKVFANGPQGGGERRIWALAGLGALLSAAFVLWLFSRASPPPLPAALPRRAPAVDLTRLDRRAVDDVVREQAELFDPTPLFLPTRLNAQPSHLAVGVALEPGTAFAAFEPQLIFDENSLTALNFPSVVAMPARPVEALAVGMPPRPLLGFGRIDLMAEPLPARGGYLEVSEAGTGNPVLAQPLTELPPPAENWAPLEFLVAVNNMGLIDPPQLAHSSGSDAVDAYFRAFLTEKLRLGARLRPGFFRVCIGP